MDTGKRHFEPNPRESANILSQLFYWWTIPLFKKGYAKELNVEDVFQPLDTDRSNALGDRLERYFVMF